MRSGGGWLADEGWLMRSAETSMQRHLVTAKPSERASEAPSRLATNGRQLPVHYGTGSLIKRTALHTSASIDLIASALAGRTADLE